MSATRLFQAVTFCALALVSLPAAALPAYSRLYQAKYGYRISCSLCHSAGGGSAINDYGRDYLRAGANLPAFARIEQKDSDGDRIANLEEITKRSNAGDDRSTPATIGDWLAEAEKAFIPEEQLRPLFPSADAFAAIEGTLKPEQVTRVEQRGVTLTDEDKVPTFYFALKGGKRFAVAQFVSAESPQGPISIAVAMDTRGTVSGVRVLKNPSTKTIEAPPFLGQFAGKKLGDALTIGQDLQPAKDAPDASAQMALAVKKAVAVINAVFSK
ncbi:MAG: hypothetical protein ACOZIN_19185 [Myxococcota bacterium]